MSIFSSNTVTLIVLHMFSTSRLENLDKNENTAEKRKKYKVRHDNSIFFKYFIVFVYHTIKKIEHCLNVDNCSKKKKKQKLQNFNIKMIKLSSLNSSFQ